MENTLFLEKLDQLNTISKRRDFNPEILNRFFIKSVKVFYNGLYGGSLSEYEKYLSEDFMNKMVPDIMSDRKLYAFSNLVLNINSINLIDQSVEGINFVSSLTLRVNLTLYYNREFIPNGILREFNEVLEEDILYKNEDTGWKIKKIIKSDLIKSVDRIIDVK